MMVDAVVQILVTVLGFLLPFVLWVLAMGHIWRHIYKKDQEKEDRAAKQSNILPNYRSARRS